jgi:hypothetical protein
LDELKDGERDGLERLLLTDPEAQEDLVVAEEEIGDLFAGDQLSSSSESGSTRSSARPQNGKAELSLAG